LENGIVKSIKYMNMSFRSSAVAITLLCTGLLILEACGQISQKEKAKEQNPPKAPLIERLTAAAWEEFHKENYLGAITNADKCIDEFLGAANRMQANLEKERKVIASGVVSEEHKAQIHSNGLLNDVGTCLFIRGRSLEKLDNKSTARKAYETAKGYTYARTWDVDAQLFWSPAEAAADRLEILK
jgi:hypothetical protein